MNRPVALLTVLFLMTPLLQSFGQGAVFGGQQLEVLKQTHYDLLSTSISTMGGRIAFSARQSNMEEDRASDDMNACVIFVKENITKCLKARWNIVNGTFSFSTDENTLAFIGASADARNHLVIWRLSEDSPKEFPDISSVGAPEWINERELLLVESRRSPQQPLRPSDKMDQFGLPAQPGVVVRSSITSLADGKVTRPPHPIDPTFELAYSYQSDLVVSQSIAHNRVLIVDSFTAQQTEVASGVGMVREYLSPDRTRLAVLCQAGPAGENRANIYVLNIQRTSHPIEAQSDTSACVSVAGHGLVPVVSGILFSEGDAGLWGYAPRPLEWSPDSSAFAFIELGAKSAGDVFVYSVQRNETRNISKGIDARAVYKNEYYSQFTTAVPPLPNPYGLRFSNRAHAPLWLPDSSALIAFAGDDLWYLPLKSTDAPRNLTSGIPYEVRGGDVVRKGDSGPALVSAAGQLLVQMRSLGRGTSGLVWISLDGHSANVALSDYSYRRVHASASGTVVFARTGLLEPEELWTWLPGRADPVKVTDLNAEFWKRCPRPEVRFLEWKTVPRNILTHGVLFLPADSRREHPRPLVIEAYPGNSYYSIRNEWLVNHDALPLLDLTAHGYAVLFVDVPISWPGVFNDPRTEIVGAIEPAIDSAVGTGLIDRKAVGFYGVSYGGLVANIMLAFSKSLSAAVTNSGVTDGLVMQNGQDRMAVSPWENSSRWIQQSPLFHIDRIFAPLLMLSPTGDDPNLVFSKRWWFDRMEAAGKPVVLIEYNNNSKGHGLSGDNALDGSIRMRLWFDRFLKQEVNQGSQIR